MLTDLPQCVAGHAINRHWVTPFGTGLYWGRPVIDQDGMEGVELWPQADATIHVLHPNRHPRRGTAAEEADQWEDAPVGSDPADNSVFLPTPEDRLPANGYGVADSVEQVLETFLGLVSDERCFAVCFQRFRRDEEPPTDHPHRWHWHYWGEYIGELTPAASSLAEEPEIEEVICFEVFEVMPVRAPKLVVVR
ncbi:hypothetical protein GCM10011374_35500 [Kocuria dechangensis]|uniref:Uncharacterized protein n=1 Tax=Kocuria dechangensis TaxID=1176249 RepID=A0A917LZK1_9MICC|nr:hypothetical protein [Kocuria dechangensis]GGG68092.1 hypothetical protein GCM10011374_35500 [Kocuria dechangensis]